MHKQNQENDVKVYALSHRGASPSGNVHLLSHRGVQYNLSYKKKPCREICGAFLIHRSCNRDNNFVVLKEARFEWWIESTNSIFSG